MAPWWPTSRSVSLAYTQPKVVVCVAIRKDVNNGLKERVFISLDEKPGRWSDGEEEVNVSRNCHERRDAKCSAPGHVTLIIVIRATRNLPPQLLEGHDY